MIEGHCECKRVQYAADSDIVDFSHCHCSQCRRMHGAAYATFAGVARDTFRYLSGATDVTMYASSDTHRRFFCSVCGSNILVELHSEPDTLYLSMGSIEGDPPRPPAYHIYVGSKAPWHEITDALPQYEVEPDE